MQIINEYLEIVKECDCRNETFYLTKENVFICTRCKKRWAGFNLIEKENCLIKIIITDKEVKMRKDK